MRKLLVLIFAGFLLFGEKVGVRPYEMDWAGRVEDEFPVVVDFEADEEWTVEVQDSVATFTRSREQQLYGKYVGKLTYRGTGGWPEIIIRPPKPIEVRNDFDLLGCWIYGNFPGWGVRDKVFHANITALFQAGDEEFSLSLSNGNWPEWFHVLVKPSPEQQRMMAGKKVWFTGFKVTNGRDTYDRHLYFDSLSLSKETWEPLTFKPRPLRGIDMFPGQDCGANRGPGRLPFPTRPETILPDSAAAGSVNSVKASGKAFELTYEGKDGRLVYRYEPKSGRWSDVTAVWKDGKELEPLVDGGARLADQPDGEQETAEHLGTTLIGDKVVTRWKLGWDGESAEVEYTMSIKGKTLVLDTKSLGGKIGKVVYGGIRGLSNPRTQLVPYYTLHPGRPGVILSGTIESPVMYSGHTCWYLSNASGLFGRCEVLDGIGYANGGTTYNPKTNGLRNDCYERFFVTIGPSFAEHLPNIPNPPTPYREKIADRIWKEHGANQDRNRDKAYWRRMWRYGLHSMMVMDHEVGWRDGGESFTFRTQGAPKKGGDEGFRDYARYMIDELGYMYGPYNNFTDFATVNGFWRKDIVARTTNKDFQRAWYRCYAPKPQYAVEYCDELTPIIQKKFNFNAIYCDVHTCVAPWWRTDYDERVPGAGTFAATFYAFGELLLKQKSSVDGPVYSEGAFHYLYAGLTDGNYAQDLGYRLAINPWLVDFELRKIHDLECGFGVGKYRMIYGTSERDYGCPEDDDDAVDRFLSVSMAMGHQGYFAGRGGKFQRALRSYYLFQQIQGRYLRSSVDMIHYAGEDGKLWTTDQALMNGALQMSQPVTRYKNGTYVATNGNVGKRMRTTVGGRKIDLPVNGIQAWTEDGAIKVFMGDRNGTKVDYCASPAYIYIDGRGQAFQRMEKAASSGCAILRKTEDGKHELIPVDKVESGFAVLASSARALDFDLKDLGPAEIRRARGLTYVMPVKDAFSYVLEPAKTPPKQDLSSPRDCVFPGEKVVVTDADGKAYEVAIPQDAKPGDRIWKSFDGQWIDFTVVNLVSVVDFSCDNESVTFVLQGKSDLPGDLKASFNGVEKVVKLDGDRCGSVSFNVELKGDVAIRRLDLVLECPSINMLQRDWFVLEEHFLKRVYLGPLTQPSGTGMCYRNQDERQSMVGTGANVRPIGKHVCGTVAKQAIFVHPPYIGGVGYAFMTFPVAVPKRPATEFRAMVGKANCRIKGDGVLFKANVIDDGKATEIGSVLVKEFEWKPLVGDLSPWAGKDIVLKLISDVGPDDNSEADWSVWAEMFIEGRDEELTRRISRLSAAFDVEIPDDHVAGLSRDQLRGAVRGWLCYQGIGVNCSSSMPSYGRLNQVDFGLLKPAGGNEPERIWSPEQRIELNRKALGKLDMVNRFEWLNPMNDCFKIQRFRILLELADGRKVSSKIATAVITSVPTWRYAEGISPAPGENIVVPIEF